MLNPNVFRGLLTMEQRIVEVSRAADGLLHHIESIEAAGGDASRLRDSLREMLAALEMLRLQRNETAQMIRKMGDLSWDAITSSHSTKARVSPVGREPTAEGCCDL